MEDEIKTRIYDDDNITINLVTHCYSGVIAYSVFNMITRYDNDSRIIISEYGIKMGYYENLPDINNFVFKSNQDINAPLIEIIKNKINLDELNKLLKQHNKKTQHKIKYIPYWDRNEKSPGFVLDFTKTHNLKISFSLHKDDQNKVTVKTSTLFLTHHPQTVISISKNPINDMDCVANEIFKNINSGIDSLFISDKERRELVLEIRNFFTKGKVGFNHFIKNGK